MASDTSSVPSRCLWVCDRFSDEQLLRALLLAERIRLPFSDIRSSPALDACFERGRLELFPSGTLDRWFAKVEARQADIDRWTRFFAQRMCEAFAAGRVTIEMHDSGKRIAWAWDDGSGAFPDQLYPRGDFFRSPEYKMRLWDQVEIDVLRERWGASHMEADFAVNAAPDRAKDRLLIDLAMSELAAEADPYSRLGLLGSSGTHLRWLAGTSQGGVTFEPMAPRNVSSVLSAMLGAPADRFQLSQIPIERFLDLCDELQDARRAFAVHLSRWSDQVAAAGDEDRVPTLAALARDEIIPAMREFNSRSHRRFGALVGAISGGDLAKAALAAVAVTSTFLTSLVLGSPEVAALGAAAAVAGGSAVKHALTTRSARARTWTAFAAALNDELGPWKNAAS